MIRLKLAASINPEAAAFDLPKRDGEISLMKKKGTAPRPVVTAVRRAYKKTLVIGIVSKSGNMIRGIIQMRFDDKNCDIYTLTK